MNKTQGTKMDMNKKSIVVQENQNLKSSIRILTLDPWIMGWRVLPLGQMEARLESQNIWQISPYAPFKILGIHAYIDGISYT